MTHRICLWLLALFALASTSHALACTTLQHESPRTATIDWRTAERGILENHVQLTHAARFIKAGEAYFSPDDAQIIFQAIEVTPPGQRPEEHYQMFVAELDRDLNGNITGLGTIKQLSPPGSSNTCGWFHPTRAGHVIFGSTVSPPQGLDRTQFQREGRDYKWAFPPEMDIVITDLAVADGSARTLQRLVENPNAYLAECAINNDGRYLVYCECEQAMEDARPDGNLRVMNLATGEVVARIDATGYDGGPFFSPDGRRLCYRSDRRGDDLLQIFVAELDVDDRGEIRGVAREFQLTDNAHVNWAPFWHPGGRHLIYTTSQMGHDNYEVFIVDADAGDVKHGRPVKYGTGKRRLTFASGFDGLPVFNTDGSLMMWTSQRDESATSQVWLAQVKFDVDAAQVAREERLEPREARPREMHTKDPTSGLIYIYDTQKHTLTAYDQRTHETRLVTDVAEKSRAMELFKKSE